MKSIKSTIIENQGRVIRNENGVLTNYKIVEECQEVILIKGDNSDKIMRIDTNQQFESIEVGAVSDAITINLDNWHMIFIWDFYSENANKMHKKFICR